MSVGRGVKRTSRFRAATSESDPTETFRNAASAARGADTYYLMSGRKVSVPPDRLVAMTVEDSKPLLSIGWTTQNNLEIR